MFNKKTYFEHLAEVIDQETREGRRLFERVLSSPQGPEITMASGAQVINMCSNNYLGLANHPATIEAARNCLDQVGYGMASGRLLCGTHQIHRQLEARLSSFLGTDDTLLYSSCYDANGGLFETILGKEDAIISDSLNHASIIDGIRLCRATRYTYASNDMAELEKALKSADAAGARYKLIATDGVFSMDGVVADLSAICDLADHYNAIVMVDDSHATGIVGARGRGSHEFRDVMGRVDIITGTLGKALGGASGGFTSGRKEVIDTLRAHSRTYMFSNALAPVITSVSLRVLDLLSEDDELRDRVQSNAESLRKGLRALGFKVIGEGTAIIPVIIGDADKTRALSRDLEQGGILAVAMAYPVVPQGTARIRMQVSALHTPEQIDRTLDVFEQCGRNLDLIS